MNAEETHPRNPPPLPDEDLPEGAVVDGLALERDVHEAFDFVVVGSGAAGAVAAHTLAKAGFSVAIVEEGPWVKTRSFVAETYPSFTGLMRQAGTQAIMGRSIIPVLQGRCVGGSTVINSAIAWRLPEDVLSDWAQRFGLGGTLTMADLEPHYEVLERDLNARPVAPDVLGVHNELFLRGGERMGFHPSVMHRYDRGCRGSGRCLTGCPNAAKQGMSVSYVPWALSLGARIYTSCEVERVDIAGARAVGVVARPSRPSSDRSARPVVRLRARRGVLVAASAVQTPNVLRRSGIVSAHLGRHFQAHPGIALFGVFDEAVHMNFGATQGAETIEFRGNGGFKPETLSMPPEVAMVRVPGVGRQLVRKLAGFKHLGCWAVQVRARAEGRVSSALLPWAGKDSISYSLSDDDVTVARRAAALLARTMFAAGAKEVWPGIHGVPPVLRAADDVSAVDRASVHPGAYTFIASHLFGTTRMGPDPRSSVVGLDFAPHGVQALRVADSSLFPTNLGVNPQHGIMAIARLVATRWVEGGAPSA